MLKVKFSTPGKVLFEGEAQSLVVPGERGVFEILMYHKPLLTRLIPGEVTVDGKKSFKILRGILRVRSNEVTAIVET